MSVNKPVLFHRFPLNSRNCLNYRFFQIKIFHLNSMELLRFSHQKRVFPKLMDFSPKLRVMEILFCLLPQNWWQKPIISTNGNDGNHCGKSFFTLGLRRNITRKQPTCWQEIQRQQKRSRLRPLRASNTKFSATGIPTSLSTWLWITHLGHQVTQCTIRLD